ncbi:type VI secretion system Vgr family protein [Diaphorobacter sp. HDW4A]|uniref:type VI secretion system Vgr family protein n=1 Tax=Diaphorobacter sp. HDW4A TaxID=2714924 RepID=UPI00197E7BE0|nr:type VI secretion system tip protein VgrG [Diaphorobacter sp. HDW4A]
MANRTFIAHSPLGDQLEFRSLEGSEQISRLFEYRVRLISKSSSIGAKSLLGKDMSIEIDLTTKLGGGGKRFLSGQVTQFTYIGRDGDYFSYEAVLRPWLWHATRRSDYKIFQFKKVPDIIKEVLGPYGFTIDDKLSGHYRSWDYMVQYGETDFNFVSRLLELEGGYFFFEHSQGSHKLVLADDIGSHSPLPSGPTTIPYYPGERAAHVHDEDFIDGWSFAEDIASGHFASDDYDFEKPKALLETKQQQPAGHTEDSRELYDWPGGYTDTGDGENYARVRIEQQKAQREQAQGEGNARNIAPGYLFTLSKYLRDDQNKEYLIESAYYRFEENVRRSDGAGGSGAGKRAGADSPTTYRISFNVVPKTVPYRSQRTTPKPHTTGPQTAVVTGPGGEEIYTDKYGRVKVQFHWDRYGKNDENSSCWIRVSQTWAGSNYGSMHIPRIGQEVIVDFLNGDPDYPIITGRVYNAMQMPPWDLPANKTQSGIKTHSSLGGAGGDGMKNGAGDANAIRFEDKKGAEQLWLHAQKDQLTEVENDEEKWVGNDRRKTIDRDEFNTIHRDRTEIVDRNEKINVHGWRTEEVDLDETLTVHKSRDRTVDLSEKVSIGINRNKSIGMIENVTIGLLKTQSIGIAYMQNVGVAKMTNVGVAWNTNVGVTMITNVGFTMNTTVGQNKSLSVGNNETIAIGDTKASTVGKLYTLTVGGGGGSGGGGGGASPPGAMNIVAPGPSSGGGGGGGGSASNITMDGKSITLTVGKSSLKLEEDGTISINGHDFYTNMTGEKQVKVDGNITMKGAKILEN